MADKKTVLIVEDEPSFRAIYRDLLKSEGYEVIEAENGQEGWDIAKDQSPDLILLDVIMPKMTGFDVLKQLKASDGTKNIPVLIFTVLGEKGDVETGLELGANDYIIKGYAAPNEILKKIHHYLAKPEAEAAGGTYQIAPQTGKGDARKLQQDIDLDNIFECANCGNPTMLELFRDYSRKQGHWFSAHFMCPVCKIDY